jgi:hypothetical protein
MCYVSLHVSKGDYLVKYLSPPTKWAYFWDEVAAVIPCDIAPDYLFKFLTVPFED